MTQEGTFYAMAYASSDGKQYLDPWCPSRVWVDSAIVRAGTTHLRPVAIVRTRLKPRVCEYCGCARATAFGDLEYHAGDCPNLPL